jgi:hypothetical protein
LGRIETIKIGKTYAISEHELARFAALPRRAGRPRRNADDGRQAPVQSATCISHG